MNAFLWAMLAWGGEIDVESRVVSVTVYADRARVVREAEVDVPAGRSELVFDDLSLQLVADSLSAEGEGNAKAVITGIDLKTEHGTEAADERIRALLAEQLKLRDALAVHQDAAARANAEIAFVTSVQATAPDKLTEATFLAADAPAQLAALSKAVGDDLRALYLQLRAAEKRSRDVRAEIERIDREMAVVAGSSAEDARAVAVNLDAGRAGRVVVRLTYMVFGASWTPRYDARHALDAPDVRFDLSGEVRQSTGEDWESVALVLSTASPQQDLAPPTLDPYFLQVGGGYAYGRAGGSAASITAFELPASREETVRADGTVRRVYLRSLDLSGKDLHRVVPRRVQSAYLASRIDWNGEFSLLPGPVHAYMGTAYVGKGTLALTPPGGKLDVSFGVDDRVVVKRERLEQVADDARPLSNKERQRTAFRTDVTNRTGRVISLVLTEQVPASAQAIFEVTTTLDPPVTVPQDGVFNWEVDLAPGEKRSFTVSYEVTWPTGQRPQLLD